MLRRAKDVGDVSGKHAGSRSKNITPAGDVMSSRDDSTTLAHATMGRPRKTVSPSSPERADRRHNTPPKPALTPSAWPTSTCQSAVASAAGTMGTLLARMAIPRCAAAAGVSREASARGH